MGKTLLIIGTGGCIGSILRFLLQLAISKHILLTFPFGTLLVNIVGCLGIGVVYGMAARTSLMSPELRFFLATGLCGGFTTFSTFSYESITLFREGHYASGIGYIVSSVLLCLLSTIGGMLLTNSLHKV